MVFHTRIGKIDILAMSIGVGAGFVAATTSNLLGGPNGMAILSSGIVVAAVTASFVTSWRSSA